MPATRVQTPPYVAVCGHTNLDVHLVVKELPKAGQSVAVVERRAVHGGTAANIAYLAGSLGVPNRLWSRVGTDFSASWRERLGKGGVDLGFLDVVAGRNTPTCFVFTDLLDRQAYVMDQGPMEEMEEFPPGLQMLNGMAKGSWLHLATGKPLAYAAIADGARARGMQVALDPGQELRFHYDAVSLRGLLASCDVLFVNEAELRVASELLEATRPEDLLMHVGILVVTRAESGASLYQDGAEPIHQPALRAARVVDPTGAGDALRAGWYAALAAGKGFEEALRWGQAAASLAVEHVGAQDQPISPSDLQARLAQQ